MAAINFVDGEKGGVGKSMFARCLAHYFECESIEYQLVDTDNNHDVADCYEGITDITFKVANEEFALSSLEADKVDQIFEIALTKPVLVNLPANVHEQVSYWIKSNDLLAKEILTETGVKLVKWFLCSGEYDSWQAFLNSLGEFDGKLTHVLVRNLGLHPNWSDLETRKDYQEIKQKYQFREINFPGLRKAEQMYIQEKRIPMRIAIDDPQLSILSRQRLIRFLRDTTIAIKQAGVIPVSPAQPKPKSKRQTNNKEVEAVS
jgi:hypothetical protein